MLDPQNSSSTPRLRRLALPALILAAVAIAGVAPAGAFQDGEQPTTRRYRGGEAGVVIGETRPSKEMELAFADLGRVAEVNVREGDTVEAGQVLMRQDLAADEALLKALLAEADVEDRVKVAETQLALAKLELQAVRDAETAVSEIEVERALLEVTAAETRILEEKRQGQIAAYRAEQQQVIVEQRTMNSPSAGVVQKVDAAVGEVFGPQTPALRVVTIDPLYVEVKEVPAVEVMKLKISDPIQVRYEGADSWQEAKVVFINPIGDAFGQSSRLMFRAELPNPEGRPAGMRIEVRMPGNEATAGAAQP
jgi:multidrug efflux pump subunit AcrA (membrane-fusion protein)